MCDECSVIYHSDTKHDITVCPIRSAKRCSVCEIYGHSTMRCPDRATWQTRVPEYIEQLIPPTLLRHHSIETKTYINDPNLNPIPCSYPPVLEVPEEKSGIFIRATLTSYNIPSSSIKTNKTVLESFGSLIGEKISYLQIKNVVEKRVIKTKKGAEKSPDSPEEKPKRVIRTKKPVTAPVT